LSGTTAVPASGCGACNDYRAAPQDLEQDAVDGDAPLGCAVLALWGEDFEWVGRAYDVAAIWRRIAPDLRTVALPGCSHLPHEEQPDKVNAELLDFLRDWTG
jgi:haloacetate dehalogenase